MSADPTIWVWGKMHGVALAPLLPLGEGLVRPAEGLPFFSRPGGEWAVSPCNTGIDGFNFTCTAGSTLRMVSVMDPVNPVTYNSIPGGTDADLASPFYDDQIDRWNAGEAMIMRWDQAEIQADAVETWTVTADGLTAE